MDLVSRKLFGEIDNNDSIERAFLYADSAAGAQVLGDERLVVFRALNNAGATCLVYWTVDNAFQAAFFWLAELLVEYRNTMSIFCFRIAQLYVIFAIMCYIAMPNLNQSTSS